KYVVCVSVVHGVLRSLAMQFFLFSIIPRRPLATLFPYTTLFRSVDQVRIALLVVSNAPVAQHAAFRLHDDAGRREVGHQGGQARSEEHTSELQSRENLVCRLLLEKKKKSENLTHKRQTTYPER